MQAQPDIALGKHPRGETCHARRFDTVDTTDDTSDATGRTHNRTLPRAGILARKHAMHVVFILWVLLTILAMLLDAGTLERILRPALER